MDVNLKQAYNEYLRKHRFKQNRGANGRNDTEKSKTYQAEWAFQKRINIKKVQRLERSTETSKTNLQDQEVAEGLETGKSHRPSPYETTRSRSQRTQHG